MAEDSVAHYLLSDSGISVGVGKSLDDSLLVCGDSDHCSAWSLVFRILPSCDPYGFNDELTEMTQTAVVRLT